MRRFAQVVLSALVLAGTLTTSATGRPVPHTAFDRAAFEQQVAAANQAATKRAGYVHDTLAWVRNNVVGMGGPEEWVVAGIFGCGMSFWH